MRRLTVFGLMIIVTALACSIPGLPGGEAQPGTQDNPVPAGEPISYEWGTLRVTAFHRPTAFQVLKADLFTGITESRPAKPATGAEFVSIELEFTCAETQTTCDEPPQAFPKLLLDDGREVEEGFVPMAVAWMGDEEVAGGSTVKGWVTFEVPVGAAVAALKLEPYDASEAIYGALPEPVDGFSIDFGWETFDDGSEELEVPSLRRDMEGQGYEMIWAGLYRLEGETGLYVTLYTDDLFFFDDPAAVEEARAPLLNAVEFWATYHQDATYLAVELWNDLSDEVVATIGADAPNVEAFLGGTLDEAGFVATWWVVQE